MAIDLIKARVDTTQIEKGIEVLNLYNEKLKKVQKILKDLEEQVRFLQVSLLISYDDEQPDERSSV